MILALAQVAALGPYRAEAGLLSNDDAPAGVAGTADAAEAEAEVQPRKPRRPTAP